jgi:hypothetical protein
LILIGTAVPPEERSATRQSHVLAGEVVARG